MERIHVTPQHVYRTNDPSFVDVCLNNYRNLEYRQGAGNLITKQDIHNKSAFLPLTRWIETEGQRLIEGLLIPGKLTVVSMWITQSDPGQHLAPHTHPLSFVSGSYYFTSNPSPVILLTENLWQEYPLGNGDDVATPLEVKTGDLVFLPSRMRHGVLPVNEHRAVLSFNAVLTEINTCSGRHTRTIETRPVVETHHA